MGETTTVFQAPEARESLKLGSHTLDDVVTDSGHAVADASETAVYTQKATIQEIELARAKIRRSLEIASDTLQLKNDLDTPGNSMAYGTTAAGVKGYENVLTKINAATGTINANKIAQLPHSGLSGIGTKSHAQLEADIDALDAHVAAEGTEVHGLGSAATHDEDDFALAAHNQAGETITSGTLPAARLPSSGVTAGSYVKASITVDATGRVTSASSNSGAGTGDVTGPATNTADYVPQWNGANSKTLKDGFAITTAGKALLDDADAAAQRVTLGLGDMAVQESDDVYISGGSIAGITPLEIASGGTGAATAEEARINLGITGEGSGTTVVATFTNASLSNGVYTFNHDLNHQLVVVTLMNNLSQAVEACPTFLTSSVCEIDLSNFGTITGTWTVIAEAGLSPSATETFENADLVAGVYTFNHNLNTQVVNITLMNGDSQAVDASPAFTSSSACSIDLSNFGTISGTWTVLAVAA